MRPPIDIITKEDYWTAIAEFVRAQLPMAGQLERVLNDFDLLVRRQAVNFFNHFGCCHEFNPGPTTGELQVSAVMPNSRAPPNRARNVDGCNSAEKPPHLLMRREAVKDPG